MAMKQEEKMTQHCPLCGKAVHAEYDADPGNLAGMFYFCRGSPDGCRATFMIHPDGEYVESPVTRMSIEGNRGV